MSIDTGEVVSYLESRMRALEESRVENTSHLAQQTAVLDALGKNFEDLCSDLKSHNHKMERFLEKLETKMDTNSNRIESLERGDKEQSRKATWKRKVLFVLITGGGGAIGTLILNKVFGAH